MKKDEKTGKYHLRGDQDEKKPEEAKTAEVAVVLEQETALAIPMEELDEMFGESTLDTSTGLSFNVVKIMRESAQFDLGNKVFVQSLKGFVLFKHRACQWWEKAFDDRAEGDDPMPQCYSIDGVMPCGGTEQQATICVACPKDVFGSDPKGGKGKACRNTMRFLFLQDEAVIPVVLAAPPTSLSKKGSLCHWLNGVPNDVSAAYNTVDIHTKKGGPIVDFWWAHVELTLELKDFGDLTASILCIETLNVITPKSDPSLIRQIFKMKNDATKLYKIEQQSYIETEASEDEVTYANGTGDDNDDEAPI